MRGKGRFEVTKLDKGFEITVYEEPSNPGTAEAIYPEPKRGVASSDAEVIGYFQKWMTGTEQFTFEDTTKK